MTGLKETRCKETWRKETGEKATEGKLMGAKETGGRAMGAKEMGGKATGAKVTGAQNNQEIGGKVDMLMGEKEMGNMLPVDTTAGLNMTEGIRRKSYSELVIEGMRGK